MCAIIFINSIDNSCLADLPAIKQLWQSECSGFFLSVTKDSFQQVQKNGLGPVSD